MYRGRGWRSGKGWIGQTGLLINVNLTVLEVIRTLRSSLAWSIMDRTSLKIDGESSDEMICSLSGYAPD
jgi:hypothetical protein